MNNKKITEECTISVGLYEQTKRKALQKEKEFTNLYVKNFKSPDFNDQDLHVKYFTINFLQDLFSKFGPIVSATIMKDENNQSKGFGFVCFENHFDAKKALESAEELGIFISEFKTKSQR